jgi:hypothetical protein
MEALGMSLRSRIKAAVTALTASGHQPLVRQFAYSDADTYAAYRAAQVRKASRDTGDVWADPKTLDLIADYARNHIPTISFGICHGCKAGIESRHLAERLACEVVGTDIAPPRNAIGVLQWDFHERREEWLGRASFVYTNALDHAFDPKKAMDTWVEQLAPGGLIFVEHTLMHAPQTVSESDPFGAHPLIMPYLVLEWGAGRYCVVDILRPAHNKPHWKGAAQGGARPDTGLDIWVFVIARRPTA